MKNRKKILIIVYKYFDEDPRPQREVGALLHRGYEVDVICPQWAPSAYADVPGIRFYSPVMARKRGSRFRYIFEYLYFLFYAFLVSGWLHLRNRYKLIQVFVMPEVLMLSSVFAKILGAKILMDWEDPSREVFLAKFKNRSTFPFLFIIDCLERISAWLADEIIVPNEGFKRAFVQRGHQADKIKIVMNAPDPRLFAKASLTASSPLEDSSLLILYNGTVLHRNGLHIAIKAIQKVIKNVPDACLKIVGDGSPVYIDECKRLVKECGLSNHVEFANKVNISEIPDIIQKAFLGLVPNVENDFTRINFPQRIMEFGLLKRPLVVARLPGIEDYITDQDVSFFRPGDHDDLADKIIAAYQFPEARQKICDHCYSTCKKLKWEKQYVDIVERLTGIMDRNDNQEEALNAYSNRRKG